MNDVGDRAQRFPLLSAELTAQLEAVEPSRDGSTLYRPCQVELASGEVVDHVYLFDTHSYIRLWGRWPDEDPHKHFVDARRVVRISESPTRVPAKLANKMYAAGESGMGYFLFTLVLNDGRRLPYVTGYAVNFPRLPEGVRTGDIIDLLPNVGRQQFRHRRPNVEESGHDCAWCLYSVNESTHITLDASTTTRSALAGFVRRWIFRRPADSAREKR